MYCVGCSLTFRACLRDFMYRMYVGCACGCLCVHKRFFSRRRRRLSSAYFWDWPFDGGGKPLRFGKDSLYHTRLVIIISAPHWIGRPKKTTRAGAAAFVVVVPERGGRGCAAFCLCSLSPIDHATSPPLSRLRTLCCRCSLAGLRMCAGPDRT